MGIPNMMLDWPNRTTIFSLKPLSLDSWQNEKLEAFSFIIGGQADISNTLQKKTTDLSEGVQVSWGFLHEWE